MARRYIVLRDRTPVAERAHRGLSDANDPGAVDASNEDRAPDPRDDSVLGYAPTMPLALVEPQAAGAADGASNEVSWGVKAVGADVSQYDGDGVTVAVLDTGIEAGHPAFANTRLTQEDFTGEGNGDGNGHGTHCAGTIFGGSVAGTRIGIAPGVRAACIGKVLDGSGHGSSNNLVDALLWAGRKRAQVIALSLGVDFPGHVARLVEEEGLPPKFAASRALADFRDTVAMFDQVMGLLRGMVKNGVVVAAAGNQSDRGTNAAYTIGATVPAVAAGVISVGAIADAGAGFSVAPFSNTRPTLCAPGVEVTSAALGNGLKPMSGTSMAAPHVAGVAALWAQNLRVTGQTAMELRSRVVTSVTNKGFLPGYDPEDFGAGRILAP